MRAHCVASEPSVCSGPEIGLDGDCGASAAAASGDCSSPEPSACRMICAVM